MATRPYDELAARMKADWTPETWKFADLLGDALEGFLTRAARDLTPRPIKIEERPNLTRAVGRFTITQDEIRLKVNNQAPMDVLLRIAEQLDDVINYSSNVLRGDVEAARPPFIATGTVRLRLQTKTSRVRVYSLTFDEATGDLLEMHKLV